jgi:hypothetical protein
MASSSPCTSFPRSIADAACAEHRTDAFISCRPGLGYRDMARSLRFWLALWVSPPWSAMATLAVVAVLLGVLAAALNDQVESSNRAIAVTLSRQVDDFLQGSAGGTRTCRGRDRSAAHALTPERTRVIIDTLRSTRTRHSTRCTSSMPAHGSSMSACRWNGGNVVARVAGARFLGANFVRRAVRAAPWCLVGQLPVAARQDRRRHATVPLRGQAALTTPEPAGRWWAKSTSNDCLTTLPNSVRRPACCRSFSIAWARSWRTRMPVRLRARKTLATCRWCRPGSLVASKPGVSRSPGASTSGR